jgi:hypothetical protein
MDEINISFYNRLAVTSDVLQQPSVLFAGDDRTILADQTPRGAR